MRLFGIVVCGGQSSRMGQDKSGLVYHDAPQYLHVGRLLSQFCEKVMISHNENQTFETDFEMLKDAPQYKNAGPVAALLTAFKTYPETNFLFIGCDYPLLTKTELSRFLQNIQEESTAAAFFNSEGKYEPLLAWYGKDASKFLKEYAAKGGRSLQQFLQQLNAQRYFPQTEQTMTSADTPEDFEKIRQQIQNTRHRPVASWQIQRVYANEAVFQQDTLAVEEPLEIRLAFTNQGERAWKSISVTMRTPGQDRELSAGFLFTEGIIAQPTDIQSIENSVFEENIVVVTLRDGIVPDLKSLDRNFYTTSSCGICGKASIEAIHTINKPTTGLNFQVDRQTLFSLAEQITGRQYIFEQTGGLHAASLFDTDANLLTIREDVGRHNALDKLIGAALLAGELPLSGKILLLSGRASFELVQKAIMAGIELIAAIGAPSSLAVELAATYGITLVGFLRSDRLNIYSGFDRIKSL